MTRYWCLLPVALGAACLLTPELVAAAGEKADTLVVVADSRRVSWSVSRFFVDVYNTNPFMFGVWCVILTGILGCGLGLITDFFMKRTGIDLTSRKIVEH
jgi:hypothetical protein